MKVKNVISNTVQLNTIPVGEGFLYHDYLYMRVTGVQVSNPTDIPAVLMSTGNVSAFNPDLPVIAVDCSVISQEPEVKTDEQVITQATVTNPSDVLENFKI